MTAGKRDRSLTDVRPWPERAFGAPPSGGCLACRPARHDEPAPFGELVREVSGVLWMVNVSSVQGLLDALEHTLGTFASGDAPRRLAPLLAERWHVWPLLIRGSRKHALVFRILQALLCDLAQNGGRESVPAGPRERLERWAWCVAAGCLEPPRRPGRDKFEQALRNFYIVSALLQLREQFGLPITYDGNRSPPGGSGAGPGPHSGCEAIAGIRKLNMTPSAVLAVWRNRPAEIKQALDRLQAELRQRSE